MSTRGIRRRVVATLGLALFVLSTNAYAAPRREDRSFERFLKRVVKAAQGIVNICGDTLRPPGG